MNLAFKTIVNIVFMIDLTWRITTALANSHLLSTLQKKSIKLLAPLVYQFLKCKVLSMISDINTDEMSTIDVAEALVQLSLLLHELLQKYHLMVTVVLTAK